MDRQNIENRDLKVLVVEDDALIADVITNELSKIGITNIIRANDGKTALEETLENRPDIIFMDIEMPEMNGIEAATLIQKTCPTPVVILTVYAENEVVVEAAEAGVGAYLVKPPKSDELNRAILIAMARFNDLMELKKLNAELTEAIERVKVLSGLLPICANCKNIRDDKGYWNNVEKYIAEHSDATFTHSICPECMIKLYPDFSKNKTKKE
ncbi:MAG: response regulator [Nitrospirota bacterium]|nr:response regulator [Nitrospirota bacterium]